METKQKYTKKRLVNRYIHFTKNKEFSFWKYFEELEHFNEYGKSVSNKQRITAPNTLIQILKKEYKYFL